MTQDDKILNLALRLSERVVAAIQPDEVEDFSELAKSQALGLQQRGGAGIGLNPMHDFLSSSILPIVYEALKDCLKDFLEAGVRSAAGLALTKLKPNENSNKKVSALDEAKLKTALGKLRANILERGLREDAADALIGLLMQDLFLPA